MGGAHLFVDLAELLQVVLQEDDPLPLSQAASSLVTVVLRTLLKQQHRLDQNLFFWVSGVSSTGWKNLQKPAGTC